MRVLTVALTLAAASIGRDAPAQDAPSDLWFRVRVVEKPGRPAAGARGLVELHAPDARPDSVRRPLLRIAIEGGVAREAERWPGGRALEFELLLAGRAPECRTIPATDVADPAKAPAGATRERAEVLDLTLPPPGVKVSTILDRQDGEPYPAEPPLELLVQGEFSSGPAVLRLPPLDRSPGRATWWLPPGVRLEAGVFTPWSPSCGLVDLPARRESLGAGEIWTLGRVVPVEAPLLVEVVPQPIPRRPAAAAQHIHVRFVEEKEGRPFRLLDELHLADFAWGAPVVIHGTVPAESFRLEARSGSLGWLSADLVSPGTRGLRLSLGQAAAVTGTVVLATPLEGQGPLRPRIEDGLPPPECCGQRLPGAPNGAFHLTPVRPGRHGLTVDVPLVGPLVLKEVEVPSDAGAVVDAGRIRAGDGWTTRDAEVMDAAHRPVRGAMIEASRPGTTNRSLCVAASALGRAAIPWPPEPDGVEFLISAKHFLPRSFAARDLPGKVVLERGTTFSARIVNDLRALAANVEWSWHLEIVQEGIPRPAIADPESFSGGTAVFEPVKPGPARLDLVIEAAPSGAGAARASWAEAGRLTLHAITVPSEPSSDPFFVRLPVAEAQKLLDRAAR